MIKVVAITGGIGSGKTTLSKYLNNYGFAVHESDKVVSSIYNKPSKLFINILKKNISNDVVKRGRVNKKKVAHFLFNNNQIKKNLEDYIHKEVEKVLLRSQTSPTRVVQQRDDDVPLSDESQSDN